MGTKGNNYAQDRRRIRRRSRQRLIGGRGYLIGRECRANYGGGLHRPHVAERRYLRQDNEA